MRGLCVLDSVAVSRDEQGSRLAPRLLQPRAAMYAGRGGEGGRGRRVSTQAPPPLTVFTEEEELMRESGEESISSLMSLRAVTVVAILSLSSVNNGAFTMSCSCSLRSRASPASGEKDGRGVPNGALHHHRNV